LPPPRPVACITCRIIDLSAVVGGGAINFIPTAINNAGQIAGYDGGAGVNGKAGTAYLINPNLSFVPFGQGFTFNVPTAISNFGKSIVGNSTVTNQYGQQNSAIAAWTLPSPTNVTLNCIGFAASSIEAGETGPPFEIASNNVPIDDNDFYGLPTFSLTKFTSHRCTITDFLARAINDQGTIVGSGGGYAAYGSTTACAKPIALPRPTNGSTEAHGINSQGDLLVSFTGPAAPAFGAEYLVKLGRFVRIP
jgi:hypothetical protein